MPPRKRRAARPSNVVPLPGTRDQPTRGVPLPPLAPPDEVRSMRRCECGHLVKHHEGAAVGHMRGCPCILAPSQADLIAHDDEVPIWKADR